MVLLLLAAALVMGRYLPASAEQTCALPPGQGLFPRADRLTRCCTTGYNNDRLLCCPEVSEVRCLFLASKFSGFWDAMKRKYDTCTVSYLARWWPKVALNQLPHPVPRPTHVGTPCM